MNFFTLVRRIESALETAGTVGADESPAREALLLRHCPDLAFASSDIRGIKRKTRTAPDRRDTIEITSTFLGLTGTVSPLSEKIPEAVVSEDCDTPTRRDFLDLFHHRALSLFFRGWTELDYPRVYRDVHRDRWTSHLLQWVRPAAGTTVCDRTATDAALRCLPAHFRRHRTAHDLCRVIEDALAGMTPRPEVAVEPFTGGPGSRDSEDTPRLRRCNHALGINCHLGTRARDPAGRIGIYLRSISGAALPRVSPGGDQFAAIVDAVRHFVDRPIDADLRLNVVGLSRLRLGTDAQLGRNAWLVGTGQELAIEVQGILSCPRLKPYCRTATAAPRRARLRAPRIDHPRLREHPPPEPLCRKRRPLESTVPP